MKRREFFKTSLAASAVGGLGTLSLSAAGKELAGTKGREYYELRAYRIKSGANHDLLDTFLEKAAIPALNRLGLKPVGAFTEVEPKDAPAVYVLIPYPSLESFAAAAARVNANPGTNKPAVPISRPRKPTRRLIGSTVGCYWPLPASLN